MIEKARRKRSFEEFIKSQPIEAIENKKTEKIKSEAVDEIEIRIIEMRLDSIKESVQRNRFVFLVITIACSAILFTLWNANFSRLRWSAFDEANHYQVKPNEGESLPVYGRKTLVAEWYRSRSIQVNSLGIKIDVADLSLMGSFSLVVITLWYFQSQRQANRIINDLLSYVDEYHKDNFSIRKMVYQGIIQNAIFSKFDSSRFKDVDETVSAESLEPESDRREGKEAEGDGPELRFLLSYAQPADTIKQRFNRILQFFEDRFLKDSDRPVWNLNDLRETYFGAKAVSEKLKGEQSWTDKIIRFLFYLPFITIVVILFRDLWNLFTPSPASITGNIIVYDIFDETWQAIGAVFVRKWSEIRKFYSIILLVLFDGFAILCALYAYILCKECFNFSEANNKTLEIFHDKTARLKRVQ